jgi:hypothetical protein
MSSKDDIKQEDVKTSKKIEKNKKEDEEKSKKEDNNNKEDKGKFEFKILDKNILELSKKPKSTEFFLLKRKRLLELNSLSFHSLESEKNKTNKTNYNYSKK